MVALAYILCWASFCLDYLNLNCSCYLSCWEFQCPDQPGSGSSYSWDSLARYPCLVMVAYEVTLLVPLLSALHGLVIECLVISCGLTEEYCCSSPSLEGLVHFVARINSPQIGTADPMQMVMEMPACLSPTDAETSRTGYNTYSRHGSHYRPLLQTSFLKHQTCCMSPHEFSCLAEPRWLCFQPGGCWVGDLSPLTLRRDPLSFSSLPDNGSR